MNSTDIAQTCLNHGIFHKNDTYLNPVEEGLGFKMKLTSGNQLIEVFVFNTNLTFLYNIDIEGFKKFQQKLNLPPVGFELTTATITGSEF